MSGTHISGKGFGIAWLRANVNHKGDSCLCWPLSCDDKGYGQISLHGKVYKSYRMMCEFVHGPAPTPSHEAAHTCGRGHKGCVNPRHLVWKTRSENQRDRVKHGTAGRPGVVGRNKLTPEQIAEVRSIGRTQTQRELGRRFNCSPTNISKILNGRRWKQTPDYLRAGLTATDVADIRAAKGMVDCVQLGTIYGVGRGVIWRIQNRPGSYAHTLSTGGELSPQKSEG